MSVPTAHVNITRSVGTFPVVISVTALKDGPDKTAKVVNTNYLV
jgi:hypothetical protein